MSKRRHRKLRRQFTPGAAPGVLIADPHASPTHIHVMAYGPDGGVEQTISGVGELKHFLTTWPVTWVNVDGFANVDVIKQLGEMFHLHPLALEDVVNQKQRPKIEHYADQHFLITQMVHQTDHIELEQLSIFLGRNYVLTFQQEVPGDCLGPVRERIRQKVGRIRDTGPDHLVYALLDAVVDHYFPVLENIGERLEDLEQSILAVPNQRLMAEVLSTKRDLIVLRRTLWPQRDAINTLIRDPLPWITDETRIYLRDCYDHVVRIIELLESYRELGSDLVELQLSSLSTRMNEVMQVLTVISTVFIPLTFIAGVYGMNFDPDTSPWNMPELRWYYGYPAVMGGMALIAGLLLVYFYRRGWLDGHPTPPTASLHVDEAYAHPTEAPSARRETPSDSRSAPSQKPAGSWNKPQT